MRNVFVSYSHRLDQSDADDFRRKFGDSGMVFSDRSLENLDIGYLSDDTIKDNYITQTSHIKMCLCTLKIQ